MPKEDPLAKARKVKAKQQAARHKSVAAQVEKILASGRINPELKCKLRYCQDEIGKGRDDGLVERRRHLMSEATRLLSR